MGDQINAHCTFFAKGSCKFGGGCKFLHGGVPAADYVFAVASGRSPQRPQRAQSSQRQGRQQSVQRQQQAARNPSAQRPQRNNSTQRPDRGARGGGGGGGGSFPSLNSQIFRDAAGTSLTMVASGGRRQGGSELMGRGGGLLDNLFNQKMVTLNLGDGKTATVQVRTEQQVVMTKPPLAVHVYFLIDASGSMSGARMDATLEHLSHMVREVLSGEDLVTVWTFSAEEKLTQLYYKTAAANINLDVLKAKVVIGNCTMLYNNCLRALDSMRKDKGLKDARDNVILRQLVVFTDGGDNKSGPEGLTNMIDELRAPGMPNFHFTCMAVDREGVIEGTKLQQLLEGCRHAKVILTDKATKDEIGKAFGKAQACLRQAKQELIERLVIESRTDSRTPVMGKLLQHAVRARW